MPELPEVETIRRDLARTLLGRRIDRIRVYHDDLILGGTAKRSFQRAVCGRRIGALGRRAKYLVFPLHSGQDTTGAAERFMRVQLRMTGRFALGRTPPDPDVFRHPGLQFELDDGRTLYYDDVRRLGGFDLLTPRAWEAAQRRLGPEPLASEFSAAVLADILAPLRAPIKNVLLNQSRVAGIGNIYASEALHRARIDPRRPAGTLDRDEIRCIHRAVRAVLSAALRHAGTSLRDYRTVNGGSGSYQNELRVYGRAGERCPRCDGTVARLVQAGRSSFFCPRCQR